VLDGVIQLALAALSNPRCQCLLEDGAATHLPGDTIHFLPRLASTLTDTFVLPGMSYRLSDRFAYRSRAPIGAP
jgi:hypothetical protein